jgi:hypothetical protein
VDAEYQTPIRGLALTAEADYGDRAYHQWLIGARYYFGSNKTLRDRQRQDDPPGFMQQILQGLGLYGADFNHKAGEYLAAHPGSGSGGGGYGWGITITTASPGSGGGLPPSVPITSPQGSSGNTIGTGLTITPPSGGRGYSGSL